MNGVNNVKHIQRCGNHSLLFGCICGEVFMLVSELCSIGSSGASKGFKQDQRTSQSIKQREKARRNNEEAQSFADVMASIYPEYFGASK